MARIGIVGSPLPPMIQCPHCQAKFLESDTAAQMRHMETAHADIIAQRLAEAGCVGEKADVSIDQNPGERVTL